MGLGIEREETWLSLGAGIEIATKHWELKGVGLKVGLKDISVHFYLALWQYYSALYRELPVVQKIAIRSLKSCGQ